MKSLNTSATIDPVCGMSVDPDRATAAYEYHRHTYFFCSHGCLEKFKSDPKVYISPQSAQQIATSAPASSFPSASALARG